MSALIASIANLKGGVGKSTTTVMMADGLAYFYGLRVLVMDLDAQANSSQMLLTERGVQDAADQGKGGHLLLNQFVNRQPPNAAEFILPNGVTLEELRLAEEKDEPNGWVSIISSHPQLRLDEMKLEENWYSNSGTPTTLANSLLDHFGGAIEPILPLFDIVLLDCPPHLSPLARAGLMMSDLFITPTMADAVCTWGVKQFSAWMKENVSEDFAEQNFVVVTRFRNNSFSRQVLQELQTVYLKDRAFGPTIPESMNILRAMDRAAPDSYNTYKGKYGGVAGDVQRLAERFAEFVEARTGRTWLKARK